MMMLVDATCVLLERTVSNASLCFLATTIIAGDIFVAVDKWKNARLEHPKATSG
jgi:hypothetical protein